MEVCYPILNYLNMSKISKEKLENNKREAVAGIKLKAGRFLLFRFFFWHHENIYLGSSWTEN